MSDESHGRDRRSAVSRRGSRDVLTARARIVALPRGVRPARASSDRARVRRRHAGPVPPVPPRRRYGAACEPRDPGEDEASRGLLAERARGPGLAVGVAALSVDRTNRSNLTQWSPLKTRREAWMWRSRASAGHA